MVGGIKELIQDPFSTAVVFDTLIDNRTFDDVESILLVCLRRYVRFDM